LLVGYLLAFNVGCVHSTRGLRNPGDALVVLPAVHGSPKAVLVYLDGLAPADATTSESRDLFVAEATKRGFAVLLPRTRGPYCDWQKDPRAWLCWPTELRTSERRQVLVAIASSAEATGASWPSVPLVAVGFSNGGFAASHFLDGAIENRFVAVGIINGGAAGDFRWSDVGSNSPKAVLLAATEDKFQFPTMMRLREGLAARGARFDWQVRDGGHALTQGDVERVLEALEIEVLQLSK